MVLDSLLSVYPGSMWIALDALLVNISLSVDIGTVPFPTMIEKIKSSFTETDQFRIVETIDNWIETGLPATAVITAIEGDQHVKFAIKFITNGLMKNCLTLVYENNEFQCIRIAANSAYDQLLLLLVTQCSVLSVPQLNSITIISATKGHLSVVKYLLEERNGERVNTSLFQRK